MRPTAGERQPEPMPSLPYLRLFSPTDAETVARLQTEACSQLWTLSAGDILTQTGQRLVAEQDGEVTASRRLWPFGEGAEDALRLSLFGERTHYSALLMALLGAADLSGRTRVLAVVREDWSEQVDFLQSTGFANVWQSYGAALDLQRDFDPERFAPQLERLYLDGFEVREWQAGEDPAPLHELQTQFEKDSPATPATLPERLSLAEFAAALPQRRTWVLWRGAEAVAMTAFENTASPDNLGTITRRDWRGQGLATALKAAALTELRREGVPHTTTGGALANLPMLRVNLRLGYRLEPMWLTFERQLSQGMSDRN